MKKVLLALAVLFSALSFVGAVYVLSTRGAVNAGYAVVPMAMASAFFAGYRVCKNHKDDNKPNE
ncbi:MAG: hypothetical protein IJN04_05255 [Clostridia bacterium]|nr:hypothetical protein [Clostridia bacterium]